MASTGVIGTELPRDPVVAGVRAACAALCDDVDDFSQAILTSDTAPKRACLEVKLPSGPVRLAAQAKGAGMISPRYATMFCFVQTDAALEQPARPAHRRVRSRSFDRISVDGQLSTTTRRALANGAPGPDRAGVA